MLLEAVTLDYTQLIFLFAGGLGIFLFGIKFMGDGLQLLAGDRIKGIIEKYTSSPLKAVFVGIIVTGLIQSSSGTTALSVGLVRAGLMTLPQAVGIVMGANIGTTVTAFLIGLKIKRYALPIMALGAFFFMFAKKNKHSYFGQAVLGFGALFYGLKLMSDGLKPISHLAFFEEFMVSLSHNPILGIIVGLGLTLIVQSSSATIGILQNLYADGAIPSLRSALPILFGDNIGTTITAFLAAIGGSAAAKRTSAFHILFNVLGAVIFLMILSPYAGVVTRLVDFLRNTGMSISKEMEIAISHGVFNISATILIFPFATKITKLITKVIKDDKDQDLYLSEELLNEQLIDQSPTFALEQAKRAVIQLGNLAEKSLHQTYNYFKNNDVKHKETANTVEDMVDLLELRIKNYLVKISTEELSNDDTKTHLVLIQSIKDFERISDHSQKLIEFFDYISSAGATIEEDLYKNIKRMFKMNLDIVNHTTLLLETFDLEAAQVVVDKEKNIDTFSKQANKSHIETIKANKTVGIVAGLFIDIINNLEKVGDHCDNIAGYIIGEEELGELDLEAIDNLIAD
ncbi:Na/Pi cotransporter family protein [Mycoplasmatota bacterium zrk1]